MSDVVFSKRRTTGSHVIEIKDLKKHFKDVKAVDGLTMEVRKGEIFGFLGPNGAGKTTTIKMLMGLIKATGGEAYINGLKAGPHNIASRVGVGYLPERVSFYNNLTPKQTLEFFCDLKGADKSVVEPLIREVGLEKEKNRKVGTFSKGMVQLVGIAQAMIGEPSLYILDEPMGGLDARWVKAVRDKIRAANRRGATVIFSSHILSEVEALCDRVAIIDRGKLVALDTVANISSKLDIKPRMEITVPGLKGKLPKGIRKIPGVYHAVAQNDTIYVTCDKKARSKIMAHLEKKGLEVEDIHTIEPSLEEAFVKLIDGGGG